MDKRNRYTKPENWLANLPRSVRFKVAWGPEKLNWVLDFSQRDGLAVLKDPELELATGEVAYFAGAGRHWPHARPNISGRDLEDFAIFVRTGLSTLFDSANPWEFKLPVAIARRLRRASPKNRELSLGYSTSDLLTAARLNAQDVIYDDFERIGRCPECSRFFVINKRQEYCSPKCSQAVRTRKWRSDPANRVLLNERRREAYVSAIAKKQKRDASRVVIQGRGKKP